MSDGSMVPPQPHHFHSGCHHPHSVCALLLPTTAGLKVDEALVLRLDQGKSNEPGDYRCTVSGCDWEASQVPRYTPLNHMKGAHGASTRKVEYETKKATKTAEERLISNREAARRYKAKVKVSCVICSPLARETDLMRY